MSNIQAKNYKEFFYQKKKKSIVTQDSFTGNSETNSSVKTVLFETFISSICHRRLQSIMSQVSKVKTFINSTKKERKKRPNQKRSTPIHPTQSSGYVFKEPVVQNHEEDINMLLSKAVILLWPVLCFCSQSHLKSTHSQYALEGGSLLS